MFDASDIEAARRETAYEMGSESDADRRWSRWHDAAARLIIANGWDGKFNDGKTRGLDGNEYVGDGEPSDGYSIDSAYEAFEAGWSVQRYIAAVEKKRSELGL